MMFIDELKRRSISSMIEEAKQVDGIKKQKKREKEGGVVKQHKPANAKRKREEDE